MPRKGLKQAAGISLILLVAIFSDAALSEVLVLGTRTLCQSYSGLPLGWGGNPKAGMLKLTGGEFTLGTNLGYREERLEVNTKVKSFWIDQTEVTVAQFADFVKATGYVTEAERDGEGVVFRVPEAAELKQVDYPWWRYEKGVSWRHPQGPGSKAAQNQPVTQVTLTDAKAYAQWLGRDLPTEAEWEYAAKAHVQDRDMEKEPRDAQGKPKANFWQGHFPLENNQEDGYQGTAPVGCYAANAFGLFDMVGNVWEQTQDVYTPSHELFPKPALTLTETKAIQPMVIKGGSHLCAQDYCVRYRPSAREAHEDNLPMGHLGFRTVWREGDEKGDWFAWLLLW